MILDDTSICFINVHLAAGQSQKAARNADIGGIMEDKAILPESHQMPFVHGGDGTAILDHELVILNGDLNVRAHKARAQDSTVSTNGVKTSCPTSVREISVICLSTINYVKRCGVITLSDCVRLMKLR